MIRQIKYLLLHRYTLALISNSIENSIPGVYTSEWQLLDHQLKDTLTISRISSFGNIYEVSYTMEKIQQEGNVRKSEYVRVDHWKAFYDFRLRHLVEINFNRSVFFIPEQHKALYEDREVTQKR